MNRRLALVAAIGLVGAGLYLLLRDPSSSTDPEVSSAADELGPIGQVQNIVEDAVNAISPGAWTPPDRAAPYLAGIYAAADSNGVPRDLMVRLVYQETRFRPEIIDGTVRSKAGATGIAQLMPDVSAAYGVDPTDWVASIGVMAQELAKLFRRFGSWTDAIGAYNWGQGNWNAYKRTGLGAKGQPRPKENLDYVAQVAGDLGYAVA